MILNLFFIFLCFLFSSTFFLYFLFFALSKISEPNITMFHTSQSNSSRHRSIHIGTWFFKAWAFESGLDSRQRSWGWNCVLSYSNSFKERRPAKKDKERKKLTKEKANPTCRIRTSDLRITVGSTPTTVLRSTNWAKVGFC